MDDIVIRVDHVSKNFRLPHEKTSSLKNIFVHLYGYIRKRRTYETQRALHDVSLEIRKGEFFGIVGRNGSGKSTLLKMLAGIYQPTKGKIEVAGKLVPFIELGVGFSPELTGRENVYLNGALLGFSKPEIDTQYDDIVKFAELEKFMDQKLKNYSSGMQVRLAFSMAVRAKADILLIDEVLAVGDADFQRKCFEYFKRLKKDQKTVIFVSHNMDAVREYCDRAALIEKSELILLGPSDKVAQEYTKLFLQDPKSQTSNADKESTRWGNGDLKTSKVTVKVVGEEIIIFVEAVAYKQTEQALYGLHIVASDGKEITAVNNRMIEQPDLLKIAKGAKLKFTWKVLNIFSDGIYSITLTFVDPTGQVFDWYSEAADFEIRRPRRSTTAVLPPIEVESTINP